jgi:hypothetical protein
MGVKKPRPSAPAQSGELGELRSYQYKIGRFSFIVQYGAPTGAHDDLLAALLMAWHGISRHWLGGVALDLAPG